MMQALNVTRWPLVFVVLGAGGAAIVLACSTFNLFMFAMANLAFIEREGWEAIRHGALWQLGELGLSGAIALASWLCFKLFEGELIARYRRWAEKPR
ncbi:MAG: hypothetical protein H6897_02580 [Rhodobacteraceae bacterium]|uniref:hypothetical protein n=1 Tax=Albidovulum sp. TaxID=1872424 RepID=UPI001D1BDA36|nr:hypothetical protein [uncultured Defluviimonas sp.]MCB2124719.1 hypothetical protein [Paracoccaceae bacterium]MCC0068796.1 hypothetical protein [Paracoccaceae bacterium]